MEWVSGSDRPRLFQWPDCTLLLTGSFWGGRTCRALINAHLGHWAAFPCFVCGWKMKMLMAGLCFQTTELWQEALCRREESWGSMRDEEGEEGVRNVRTKSLGDHSPGSPSLWQLWKFIAIDFVISSLSIGSTWAHWWIARKLFLRSCFFFSPSSKD